MRRVARLRAHLADGDATTTASPPPKRGNRGAMDSSWSVHGEAKLARQRGDQNVIMLSVGDHDKHTSEWIVDEAVRSLRAGRHHYTPFGGERDLREAVAAMHSRYGMPASWKEVVCFPGSQCALFRCAPVCASEN